MGRDLGVDSETLQYMYTVDGTEEAPALLRVRHDLLGPLEMYGPLGSNAAMEVWHDVSSSAYVYIRGALDGNLTVGNDLQEGALIAPSGHVNFGNLLIHGTVMDGSYIEFFCMDTELVASLLGNVQIDGDLNGSLFIQAYLEDLYDDWQGGHIIINGSFRGEIGIGLGFSGNTEYIVVDYDGYDPGDRWQGGVVDFPIASPPGWPTPPYYGNTPDAHVYEITCLPGDMDNSCAVNGQDIDGFIMVLFGDIEEYQQAYPPFAGSWLYHGDMNSDKSVNVQDIDGFVACLFGNCTCPTSCGGARMNGAGMNDGGGDSGLGEYTPANVAAVLMQNVAPQRQAYVVALAAQLAGDADPQRAEFWTAVLAELQ